jgi:hypothetical protein
MVRVASVPVVKTRLNFFMFFYSINSLQQLLQQLVMKDGRQMFSKAMGLAADGGGGGTDQIIHFRGSRSRTKKTRQTRIRAEAVISSRKAIE